ncbi:MAG: outer membrane beta-barrel protein [Stenotrophomonas sp.]
MRKTLILAALLAATPFAAAADEMSYTYVEGGWTQLQINDNFLDDPKGDGGYVRGSFAIAPQMHVFGGYSMVSKSYGLGAGTRVKFELAQPEIGIGYHMNMSERVDFTADLALLRVNAKATISGMPGANGTEKDHSNAGRVTVGVRGKPSPRTEAWLKGGVMDGSDLDTTFVGNLGGQVNLTRTWGLVGEIQWIDDTTQFLAGVRASF